DLSGQRVVGRQRQLADLFDAFHQLALRFPGNLADSRNALRFPLGEDLIGGPEYRTRVEAVAFERLRDARRRDEDVSAQRDARHADAEELVERGELRVVRQLGRTAEEDVGLEDVVLEEGAGQGGGAG